jgi:rod shape-determining protein MreC
MAHSASLYNEQVARLEGEIDNLRRMIGLPAYGDKQKVPCEVIGFFPYENRITVSAGKSQGIEPGMAVVSGKGLVGVVQSVDTKTSQATLIYSPRLKMGAIALRNPPAAGLLKGETRDSLVLEFLDFKAPVQVGDEVVTSGYSDKIPYGIPIGRVMQVQDDVEFGTRSSVVYPHVQIGEVREVFILK